MKNTFELECSNTISIDKKWFKKKTKEELIETHGLCYNDINSEVWMYRIKSTNNLLSYRYVYIIFDNDKVSNVHFTRYKTCRFHRF